MSTDPGLDRWAAWILHRRDGDDPEQQKKALEYLIPIRDTVLGNARIRPGDTLLDVGAGNGLIAFGALERVGPEGHVIASDISADLVARTRAIADELGVTSRMSFIEARAEDLSAIADRSEDHEGPAPTGRGAGFNEVHVQLVVDVEPGSWVVDWERLLNTSPNPNGHTASEAIRGALSTEEAERLERHVRPLVDAGRGVRRQRPPTWWRSKPA